jgi:hypothetical protein
VDAPAILQALNAGSARGEFVSNKTGESMNVDEAKYVIDTYVRGLDVYVDADNVKMSQAIEALIDAKIKEALTKAQEGAK